MTRPSRRGRVLIAGGGIGGLCAAIALARRGIESTVLERNDFTEESGAGIQLGPNATRILRGLGALEAIENAAFRPEALVLFDGPSGRELVSMPLGDTLEARYGAPYLTLHRADLHAGLLATCRSHEAIELRSNFQVCELGPLTDGVAARSMAGEETDGSCLVGADGLWSSIRRLVAPHARLRFARATAWRALLPREGLHAPFNQPWVGLWLGPRAHLVHYPVRGGKDVNIVAVVDGGEAQDGWNVRANAAGLLPAFARWAPPAAALVREIETWRCWSLYRLAPLPRWSHGRMAVLGDAAHPVLPYLAQGAALGIEDAEALAESLELSGDPLLALPRYEGLRRHRAARVQRQAARYGRLYHLRGPLASARNFMLARKRPHQLLASFDWLYGPAQTQG